MTPEIEQETVRLVPALVESKESLGYRLIWWSIIIIALDFKTLKSPMGGRT